MMIVAILVIIYLLIGTLMAYKVLDQATEAYDNINKGIANPEPVEEGLESLQMVADLKGLKKRHIILLMAAFLPFTWLPLVWMGMSK